MIRTLVYGVLAFALQLSAAESAGTWEGSLEITGPNGQTQSEGCYMRLERSGGRITGAVGPDRSVQWKIQNGKFEGTRITFEARPPEGGRLMFDLRLAGDHVKGEARGENRGLTFHAKVNLTRTNH